jgi:SAM-dependent methyltransferase
MTDSHQTLVSGQFGPKAQAYVDSAVHAQGEDLRHLAQVLAAKPGGRVLDVGCGGGHATYAAAPHCREVVASDLSDEMLAVVRAESQRRGLTNIVTAQGGAASLPFADGSFDWVISRYSAHHWPWVCKAMVEARRLLPLGGGAVFMDVVAPEVPLLDTWLQSLELLRDPSHLRNRSIPQWRLGLEQAGFAVKDVVRGRIRLEFSSWISRMNTPEPLVAAIRYLQGIMPAEVAEHFALEADGSFQLDVATIVAEAV